MQKRPKNPSKKTKSGSLRTSPKFHGKEDNILFIDFEEYALYQHHKGCQLTEIKPIKL